MKEPITRHVRSEWDMDVDNIYQMINELSLDNKNRDNDFFEEEEEEDYYREEEDDEEEINNISPRQNSSARRVSETLNHLINNVLTDEQRAALRNGECFFCKKKGHFY